MNLIEQLRHVSACVREVRKTGLVDFLGSMHVDAPLKAIARIQQLEEQVHTRDEIIKGTTAEYVKIVASLSARLAELSPRSSTGESK